jgi:hypothetical protein
MPEKNREMPSVGIKRPLDRGLDEVCHRIKGERGRVLGSSVHAA